MIGQMLNALLKPFGRKNVSATGYALLVEERDALRKVAARWTTPDVPANGTDMPIGIVFSKDRAFQLHGLVNSFLRHCQDPTARLHVVYAASHAGHAAAYEEVFTAISTHRVRPHRETQFRAQVLDILGGEATRAAYFLVDDILFVAPFSLQKLGCFELRTHVPSLRIAANQNYCYTRSIPQQVPLLSSAGDEFIRWSWAMGEHDWGFPLALDGHLFDRRELVCLLEQARFHSPNSLENSLQIYLPIFSGREGLAYREPRLINTPWNRVQNEILNRHGQHSAEDLLQLWRRGEELDIERYAGAAAASTHDELPLHHRPRTR